MGDPIEEPEGLHRALSPFEGVHPERQQYKTYYYQSLSAALYGRPTGVNDGGPAGLTRRYLFRLTFHPDGVTIVGILYTYFGEV